MRRTLRRLGPCFRPSIVREYKCSMIGQNMAKRNVHTVLDDWRQVTGFSYSSESHTFVVWSLLSTEHSQCDAGVARLHGADKGASRTTCMAWTGNPFSPIQLKKTMHCQQTITYFEVLPRPRAFADLHNRGVRVKWKVYLELFVKLKISENSSITGNYTKLWFWY